MQTAASPDVIRADGLRKTFGPLPALDGVDLRVGAGESLAVFGPNGAGKTTLIRVLTLGLGATQGSLRIGGRDPAREALEIRASTGLISHQTLLYDDLTATENLEFFGRLYGVADPSGRAATLLRDVGLELRADDPAGSLSRGMQQRLSIARALMHAPEILFLDEPFTGLDVHAGRMLRETLQRLRSERRTVVLVTHHLTLGLELSDHWIILRRGRLVDRGVSRETDPASFEARYVERVGGARA